MPINIQLAAMRDRLSVSSYSISVVSASNYSKTGFTTSGSIDLYLQAQNRAGFNLQSDKQTVSYTAGQAILITFNSNAIASGEEIFALVVSGDTTGDFTNAVQLACVNTREFDQVTSKSLPLEILLHHDTHLAIDTQVATSDDLPSGEALITGAVYSVVEDAEVYIYNPDAPDGVYPALDNPGYWLIQPFARNTYIEDTFNLGANNTPLDAIEVHLGGLPKLSGAASTPIRYWVSNDFPEDSGTVIVRGTRYQFEFIVDGLLNRDTMRSYNLLFGGLIGYKFLGLVRLATGVLYTDVGGADSNYIWNPGLDLVWTLQSDVPPGYAAAVDIWFTAQSDRLLTSGMIRAGQDIRLNDIYSISSQAERSDLWHLTGDCALNIAQRCRVVPTQVLPGKMLIKGYRVPIDYPSQIVELEPDTANQIIAISAARNGDVTVRNDGSTLDSTEAQRALVSTLAGYCTPSSFSDSLTLATGERLTLEITLPLTTNNQAIIRTDYPDVRIAGIEGIWNNPQVRLFLIKDGVIYYQKTLVESGNASTLTLSISTLDDFEEIPLIPQPTDPYFGLYGYGNLAIASATDTSSTLSAGEYQYAIAWVYPSPNYEITAIDHDELNGSLKEIDEIFQSNVKYWNEPIATVAEARAFTGEDLKPGKVWLINNTQRYIPYVYDPQVTGVDNGISIIKPTVLSNTSGALVPVKSLGHRIVGSNGLLPARHNIRFQGATVADDPANNTTAVIIPDPQPPITETATLLTWGDGSIMSFNEDFLLDY